MRVVPVVESPLQLFQVAVQVFPAHLVEGADNRPLEQAPHALDAVGVDLSDNPLLRGVAHGPVYGVMIFNPHVGLQLIGVNRLSLILNCSMYEIMESVTLDIRDALDSDLSAVPLDGTDHPCLAFLATRSDVAFLSTDQGFVHFHDSEQGGTLEGIIAHSLTDAVAQVPSRPICGSDGALELVGRDAFLGLAHQPDRQEPLTEGQVRVVHDGPGGHGELIPA